MDGEARLWKSVSNHTRQLMDEACLAMAGGPYLERVKTRSKYHVQVRLVNLIEKSNHQSRNGLCCVYGLPLAPEVRVLTFLGIPIDILGDGDGALKESLSLPGTFDARLNIDRRPCFEGELGGLGVGNGTSESAP